MFNISFILFLNSQPQPIYVADTFKVFQNTIDKHVPFWLYPTAFKGSGDNVFTHGIRLGWVGRWREKKILSRPDCVSCRRLILGRDIGGGCRYALSWCDFDLTLTLL